MSSQECSNLKNAYENHLKVKERAFHFFETVPVEGERLEEFRQVRERVERSLETLIDALDFYQIKSRKSFMERYQRALSLEDVGKFTEHNVARAARLTPSDWSEMRKKRDVIVNDKGRIVLEDVDINGGTEEFSFITPFTNGYAFGVTIDSDVRVFIDSSGSILPIGSFEECGHFSEDLAWVCKGAPDKPKYYFINDSGDDVFKERYEEVGSFSEGVAPVKFKGKWYFMDTQGEKTLIDIEALHIEGLSCGRALVRLPNFSYTYIKKNGALLNSKEYTFAYTFAEGRGLVSKEGEGGEEVYVFIDVDDNELFNACYKEPTLFHCGRALVNDGEGHYYIDMAGKPVFALEKPYLSPTVFQEGIATFVRDKRTHYKDRDGNDVWPALE